MDLVSINPSSPVPPYEQLRVQITRLVEQGQLLPGSRLPPVRRLATDLNLAANTVARAYRELERAGIVETDGRRGTFILERADDRQQAAVAETRAYLGRMDALGFGPRHALALVRREVERPDTVEREPVR